MLISFSTKNKTVVITAAVALVTLIIGYNFIYKINMDRLQKLRKASEDNKRTNALLHEIDGMRVRMNAYLSKGAASADISQFSSDIASAAASCGIKIDSMVPGKSTTDGDFTFLACRVNFTCPYRKLRLFLAKLEGDEKFIRVENMSMRPVKVSRKGAEGTEGELWDRQPMPGSPRGEAAGTNQMLKKNNTDGIWLNTDMEITGFYVNADAING